MVNDPGAVASPEVPPPGPVYQIRFKGHLGAEWADWFDGLTIHLTDRGETVLTGPVPDQAALFGLLKKVRDLGMPLLAVNYCPAGEDDRGKTGYSDIEEISS